MSDAQDGGSAGGDLKKIDASDQAPASEPDVPSKLRYKSSLYAVTLLTWLSLLLTFGSVKYIDAHNLAMIASTETVVIGVVLIAGIVFGIYAVKIMVMATDSPRVVITKEDRALLEQLIRDGNEKGIDQYVRLSSLSGVTGTYTKLGLTGLPLATIGLTLFFSVVSIFHESGFLDLAKLTLGAFIGSFVQRNVAGEKLVADTRNSIIK